MTDNKEYLSKEKLAELKLELEDLSTTKRREIAQSLEQAKSLGDLRENSEYQEARTAQAALEERIAYLASVIKRAVIVESHHSSKVEVGTTLVVCKSGSKDMQKLTLVGSSEADIASGKVSNESPIGQAMIGKKKGETFVVKTIKGNFEYKIIDIE